MATSRQRDHLLMLMKWLVDNEPLIDYAQVRPMANIHTFEQQLADKFKRQEHVAMDCSESVTCLCKWAGLQDPNGAHYDGSGFTGTMLSHLPHYALPQRAGIGGLVVFGPGTGEHVCMVFAPGPDPMLFSHGQNRGPILIRLSEERRYHAAPVTLLDVSGL